MLTFQSLLAKYRIEEVDRQTLAFYAQQLKQDWLDKNTLKLSADDLKFVNGLRKTVY